jgi:hypothetical protein
MDKRSSRSTGSQKDGSRTVLLPQLLKLNFLTFFKTVEIEPY